MNDRPSATELLAAVERFLEETAVPGLEGPAKYHARVAANVVRIVARELATEDELLKIATGEITYGRRRAGRLHVVAADDPECGLAHASKSEKWTA